MQNIALADSDRSKEDSDIKRSYKTTFEGVMFNFRRRGHGTWPRVCSYCRLIIGNLFVFHKRGVNGKARYYHEICAEKAGFETDKFRAKTVFVYLS